MESYGSGSTGYTSASRIVQLLNFWFTLPEVSRTSARFADLWSSRGVHYLDTELPYEIGGGEGNSAAGWSSYVNRLHGSSRNLSSGGSFDAFGLPNNTYREFLSDRTLLQAQTSAIDTTADVAVGRRLYQFLVSSLIDNTRYTRGGQHQELLIAWSAVGSSAAPTTG